MLTGKRVLLGISGSIAAYKSIVLLRLLIKAGAEVRVVITPAAADFVSPLVLGTLSKHDVVSSLSSGAQWANHVALGRWADLMLIAPASCNTIAKMASGLCDNALMATYLSATCPVAVAPAMDEDMWHHHTTQRNLKVLKQAGHAVLEVGEGELASGLFGKGRLAEPDEMFRWIVDFFQDSQILKGKTVVITAGPTYEAIDPVRFIGNHSSGLMGVSIAHACLEAGATVHLVLGPSHVTVRPEIQIHRVTSAGEMFNSVKEVLPQADIAIMSAAVADYRPETAADEKIKKSDDALTLKLVKNPDILAYAGHQKQPHQIIVGFALETSNEKANAHKKLVEKNADFIVLNSLRDEDAGFGKSTNKVSILAKDGTIEDWPTAGKTEIATSLVKMLGKHMVQESQNNQTISV